MAFQVYLNGVAIGVQALAVDTVVNGRATLTATLKSRLGTLRGELDDLMVVIDNGTTIFGGMIDQRTLQQLGDATAPAVETDFAAIDYNSYMDRRVVHMTIPAGTLKAALQALVPLLAPFGVVLDPTQVTGPTLTELGPYDYRNFKDVMDELVLAAGNYIHQIDPDKLLKAVLPGSVPAPFNITDSNRKTVGDLTVFRERGAGFANRVIVRYNSTTEQTDEFEITADNNGQDEFPLSAVWASDPGYFTLDGTPNVPLDPGWTVENRGADTSLNARFAAVYGSWTNWNALDPNPIPDAQDLWDEAVSTWGALPGANWNAQRVTYSATGWFLVAATPPVLGTTIAFTYTSSSQAVVYAPATMPDQPWEMVIEAPDSNEATAQAIADAAYAAHSSIPLTITYQTYESGLVVGQTQVITCANRDLTAVSCLITEIHAEMQEQRLLKTVTALDGSVFTGNWRDTYVLWSGGTSTVATGVSSLTPASVSRISYFLGGSQSLAQQSSTPTWVPMDANIITPLTDMTVTVVQLLKAASGSVTARLRDLTTGTTVGTSAAVTNTAFEAAPYGADLLANHSYRVELLPSLANVDVAGIAYTEALT